MIKSHFSPGKITLLNQGAAYGSFFLSKQKATAVQPKIRSKKAVVPLPKKVDFIGPLFQGKVFTDKHHQVVQVAIKPAKIESKDTSVKKYTDREIRNLINDYQVDKLKELLHAAKYNKDLYPADINYIVSCAIKSQNKDIHNLFLGMVKTINKPDCFFESFEAAIFARAYEFLKLILKKKWVDPNHYICHGENPLEYAITRNEVELAKILIDGGANLHLILCKDRFGESITPFRMIKEIGSEKMKGLLRENEIMFNSFYDPSTSEDTAYSVPKFRI